MGVGLGWVGEARLASINLGCVTFVGSVGVKGAWLGSVSMVQGWVGFDHDWVRVGWVARLGQVWLI